MCVCACVCVCVCDIILYAIYEQVSFILQSICNAIILLTCLTPTLG